MPANFIKVETLDTLERLFTDSFERPVVLLKHSTSCGISSGVYREVSQVGGDVNVVVVQTHRDLSHSISHRTGIRHESPQAIVLVDGQAVYHASHYDIEAEHIEASLAESGAAEC
jgi:bacillithiol system protein YtxJ